MTQQCYFAGCSLQDNWTKTSIPGLFSYMYFLLFVRFRNTYNQIEVFGPTLAQIMVFFLSFQLEEKVPIAEQFKWARIDKTDLKSLFYFLFQWAQAAFCRSVPISMGTFPSMLHRVPYLLSKTLLIEWVQGDCIYSISISVFATLSTISMTKNISGWVSPLSWVSDCIDSISFLIYIRYQPYLQPKTSGIE